MVKPVILAVDDPQVLRADSVEPALGTLGKLNIREDPAALFLVGQRMPSMIGESFRKESSSDSLTTGGRHSPRARTPRRRYARSTRSPLRRDRARRVLLSDYRKVIERTEVDRHG